MFLVTRNRLNRRMRSLISRLQLRLFLLSVCNIRNDGLFDRLILNNRFIAISSRKEVPARRSLFQTRLSNEFIYIYLRLLFHCLVAIEIIIVNYSRILISLIYALSLVEHIFRPFFLVSNHRKHGTATNYIMYLVLYLISTVKVLNLGEFCLLVLMLFLIDKKSIPVCNHSQIVGAQADLCYR